MSIRGGKTGPCHCSPAGFTVYEILVALLIAGAIIGIGVPSDQFPVVYSKHTTGSNTLVSTPNLSRSGAVTQSIAVSVCSNTNRAECSGKAWSEGWLVFVEENVHGMINGTDAYGPVSNRLGAGVDVSLSGPAYLQFQNTERPVSHCDNDCMNGNADGLYADQDYSNTLPLLIRLLPGMVAHASESGGPQVQGATETLVSEKSRREHGAGLGQGGVVDLGDGGTSTEDSYEPATASSAAGSGLGPSPSFATFQLCNGGTGRTITVNSTGRVKVADSSC